MTNNGYKALQKKLAQERRENDKLRTIVDDLLFRNVTTILEIKQDLAYLKADTTRWDSELLELIDMTKKFRRTNCK